tara:strand:+ start:178 stop:582 length:405 start_codon:yes stop_codon:yes gene_type:complete
MSAQYLFAAAGISQELHPDLSSAEKLVLIVLANRADKKGHCYPSYETIANEAYLSVRTACRVVKSLCEKQLISKHNNYKDTGYQTSNTYALRYDIMTGGGDTVANETTYTNSIARHEDKPLKLVAHKNLASLAG